MKKEDMVIITIFILMTGIGFIIGEIREKQDITQKNYMIPKPVYKEIPQGKICLEYKNITWWQIDMGCSNMQNGIGNCIMADNGIVCDSSKAPTKCTEFNNYFINYSTKEVCIKNTNAEVVK